MTRAPARLARRTWTAAAVTGLALSAGVLSASPSGAAAPPAAEAAAGDTAFGAVVKPRGSENWTEAMTRAEQDYGRLAVIRLFDANAPDPWKTIRGKVTNHPVIASWKIPPGEVLSGAHDQKLRTWFQNAPRTRPTWFSYIHEPEDDVERGSFAADEYRAAFARISALADEAGNPRLKATLILQCYTVNPRSGRDWLQFYAGDAAVDVIGWDCYNHKTNTPIGYGKPSDLFGKAIEASRSVQKPWGVAEVGSLVQPGDDGTGRGAWLTAVARYLFNQNAQFVSYFDTNGAGTDYRLLDAPSKRAWRAVVSDQRP
ncbi:MAG TPA: hypothetical protein VFR07_11235 [Mycobacteriales bacterium]|jgi:hypothetical protein|nr:hypothetical protein [Mycobacteriales bacterium]